MDYDTLVATLLSFSHRSDLSSDIDTLISLAQKRINTDLDSMFLYQTTTINFTGGDPRANLPADYLEAVSVTIPYSGGVRHLKQQSLYQNAKMYEAFDGEVNTPQFYAITGPQMELAPTPPEDLVLTMVYKQELTTISGSQTDTILTRFPNVYIYASMLEIALFTRDKKNEVRWEKEYKEAVGKLNETSEEAEWSGAPLQIKQSGITTW